MPQQASVVHDRRPVRRSSRRLAALALVTVVALLFSACSPEQMAALDRMNATRVQHGQPEVGVDITAMAKAQAWADHLAATGTLSHSVLSADVSPGWIRAAENVGRGHSAEAVEASFLSSPHHRANLLFPGFNSVGTGVPTAADGTVYVVQVFLQY